MSTDATPSSPASAPAAPAVVPLLSHQRVIPSLFSAHSLNIMVGAPHIGVNSLLLPAVARYLTTGNFLAHPAPRDAAGQPMVAHVGYLACDRSYSQTQDRLRATLPDLNLPYLARVGGPFNSDGAKPVEDLYQDFPEPRPQFLLIDNLQMLMDSGKIMDYHEVAHFCDRLTLFCERNRVTILGTLPTSKVVSGDEYKPPSPLGSIAWLYSSLTHLRLELVDARKPEDQQGSMRKLTIAAPWAPPETQFYDFDELGHLARVEVCSDWRETFVQRLQALPLGQPIPKATFVTWGREMVIGEVSVEGWLTDAIRSSALERIKKGTYRRPYQT